LQWNQNCLKIFHAEFVIMSSSCNTALQNQAENLQKKDIIFEKVKNLNNYSHIYLQML